MIEIIYALHISAEWYDVKVTVPHIPGWELLDKDQQQNLETIIKYKQLLAEGLAESDPLLYGIRNFYINVLSPYFAEDEILDILPKNLRNTALPKLSSFLKRTEHTHSKARYNFHNHDFARTLHYACRFEKPLLSVSSKLNRDRMANELLTLSDYPYLPFLDLVKGRTEYTNKLQQLSVTGLGITWTKFLSTDALPLTRFLASVSPYSDDTLSEIGMRLARHNIKHYLAVFEIILNRISVAESAPITAIMRQDLHDKFMGYSVLDRCQSIKRNSVVTGDLCIEDYLRFTIGNLVRCRDHEEVFNMLIESNANLSDIYIMLLCHLDLNLGDLRDILPKYLELLFLLEKKISPKAIIRDRKILQEYLGGSINAVEYVKRLCPGTNPSINHSNETMLYLLSIFPWFITCKGNNLVSHGMIEFLVRQDTDWDIFRYIVSNYPSVVIRHSTSTLLCRFMSRSGATTFKPKDFAKKLNYLVSAFPETLNESDVSGLTPLGHYYNLPFALANDLTALTEYDMDFASLVHNPLAIVMRQPARNQPIATRPLGFSWAHKDPHVTTVMNGIALEFCPPKNNSYRILARTLSIKPSKNTTEYHGASKFLLMQHQIDYALSIILLFYASTLTSSRSESIAHQYWLPLCTTAFMLYGSVISSLLNIPTASELDPTVPQRNNNAMPFVNLNDVSNLARNIELLIGIFKQEYYLDKKFNSFIHGKPSDSYIEKMRDNLHKTHTALTLSLLKYHSGIISHVELYHQVKHAIMPYILDTIDDRFNDCLETPNADENNSTLILQSCRLMFELRLHKIVLNFVKNHEPNFSAYTATHATEPLMTSRL